jgi:HEAT repeat protein
VRAPKNEATGTSGESEVLAQFERLGWGAVIDSRHDTGTDLYLRPRDARRYELGAVMGAQVKTGSSYFGSPKRDADGTITGWWFAEDDREHFDYWLRHALPHVVILRDQDRNLSHWVHITPERVISTGKGAKILVPASQSVDADHNEALSDVALTQLPSPAWDGTAWTGAVHLVQAEEIRHALITPRLIAPHPNLAPNSITGLEALAMQVLLRDELERILNPITLTAVVGETDAEQKGLSLDDAREADDWCWRATAALHLWYYQGESADLLRLVDQTSTSAQRAAAFVLCCVYHFDKNDPDTALQLLQDALEHDDYSSVDHAWLEAQRARALLEVGRQEEAFDLAMKTQRIHREAPSDVTATAIAGACAMTSFRAADWMQGDIANIIQRSDNPASWWKTQVMSYGLIVHLSEGFRSWSEDASIRIGGSDTAHKHLLSAALLASSAGDQDGWRGATGALAKHFLIATGPTDDPDKVAGQLTLLRLSGDSKSTARATRHIVRKGPIMAARIATSDVNLSHSTRTTAAADIELLTAGGDVLEQAHADEICTWALVMLQDPKGYLERTRPTFRVLYKIIDLLKSMVWALSEDALHNVIDYFLDQPPITDDGTAQTLAPLIHAIPVTAWREDDRRRAATRADRDAAYLREAFLKVAAPAIVESREQVLQRARAGELVIFEAIDDVRTLPSDAVNALADRLCNVIDSLIDDAAKGAYSIGGLDPGHALALLGIWHPSSGKWDRIKALLTDPAVQPQQQSGVLKVLADRGETLTDPIKTQLFEAVSALRNRDPVQTFFGGDKDIRGLAAEAFAALVNETSREPLIRDLLGGNAVHRAASARIIERFGDKAESELLLALAGDTNETVRNAALKGLSKRANEECASQGVVTILSEVLESGGRRSAAAVVSRLHKSSDSPAVSQLLAIAAQHPSAQIRKAAREGTTD